MVIVALGFIFALITAAVLILVNVADRHVENPTMQRLAVLSDREIELNFVPVYFPPYQFLMGVKGAPPACPPFEAVITISGPDGKETQILIDSGYSKKSNWLDDPSETGYILTQGKDPSLSETLMRGRSYRVRVRFEEPLPEGTSLWFSSMRHIPIFGMEDAH